MASNEVLVVVSRDAIQSISCDGYTLEARASASGPSAGEISGIAAAGGSAAVSYSAGVARYSSRLELERDAAFGGYSNNILSIAVTPDDNWIATGGGNATVTVWSRDMNPLHYLAGHTDWVRFVKFTRMYNDTLHLFSAGDDGLILHWDPLTGVMLSRLDYSQGQGIQAFEVSWEKGLIAVACDNPTIALYKPQDNEGKMALRNGEVARLENIGRITDAHRSVPTAVRFSRDSQWVISAGEDETLAVSSVCEPRRMFVCCDFITRRHCMTFMNTFTSLCILASPPDSTVIIIAACASDGTVIQWVVNPTTSKSTYTKKLQLHLGALVAMDVVRGTTECL
ncbi:1-alkyl-2-acetylglycerophosphocholine esterase [Trypanosoma grayi]|uniref:1-alkyl-2-acetylglycerophosphocholine esterase n=1 Tax=Trypanosoma grayi TaxID=71804 RepID=UPI0004F488DF|nr:1-alkyl-2-acetylglycerophosphocholine esterase [Trypanosoma grayi]KEG12855.1 1-alkyl-2-acetylglycerophosphocholine esterase [Trypanosoma grayi]